ncbi:MAG: sel1 repeat family protein, partial [Proteobacteria bacterium]|nr:sel1 repeat family protein [Pseudomonadota bacterium]
MPRAVFVIGLLVVLAVPLAGRAAVDPFEAFRCERAYGDRDFAAAREICLPLAEAGLADAQAILGGLYRDGLGVARDYGAAARWYGAAARQGHVGARFHLGTMYRYGVGVPRDEVEAHAWFALAAEAGHA